MTKEKFITIISLFFCLLLFGCSGGIEGKVVDRDNQPIQDVKVTILDTQFETTTNQNGEYKIAYVPGALKLYYEKSPCYIDQSIDLNISKKMKYPLKNIVLGNRVTELSSTIENEDFKAAKELIKCFPDEIKPELNSGLYYTAVFSNDTDLAKILIDNGADVNNSSAPLLAASGAGNGNPRIDMVSFLIDNGADVNTVNRHGSTAIFSAADYSAHDIAELLLEKGANPNVVDIYNGTALIRASRKGDFKMLRLLVENGADVNLKDKKDNSPLNSAKTDEIKQYLVSKGAK